MEIAAPAPVATRKSAGNAFLERLLMVNRAPPLPTARQDRAEMATAVAPKGKVQAAPAATPTATVGLAPLAMKSEIMSAFLPCRLDGQRWDLELCSRLTLRLSTMLLVVRSRLVMLALFKKTIAPTVGSTSSLKERLGGMTRVQSRSPRRTASILRLDRKHARLTAILPSSTLKFAKLRRRISNLPTRL